MSDETVKPEGELSAGQWAEYVTVWLSHCDTKEELDSYKGTYVEHHSDYLLANLPQFFEETIQQGYRAGFRDALSTKEKKEQGKEA